MSNAVTCRRRAAMLIVVLIAVVRVASAQAPPPTTVEATDFIQTLYRPLVQDVQANGGPTVLVASFVTARELHTHLTAEIFNLPTASNSGGFSWTYDAALGTWSRSVTSFGPQFVERSNTAGRHKVNFGVTWERFTFDHLGNRPLAEASLDSSGAFAGSSGSTSSQLRVTERATLSRADVGITTMFVNYGIMPALDAGVFLSTVSVAVEGTLHYDLQRTSPNLVLSRTVTASGRSQIVTTPVFRGKWNVLRRPRGGLALAADLRPHGRTTLGAGGLRFQFIASGEASGFHAHVNTGYEGFDCDGSVELGGCGSVDGSFIVGGVDKAVATRLTLSASVQAQGYQVGHGGALGQTASTAPVQSLLAPLVTTTRVTTAMTARFNLWNNLLLTATGLMSTNSYGLGDRFTPVIGFDYAW